MMTFHQKVPRGSLLKLSYDINWLGLGGKKTPIGSVRTEVKLLFVFFFVTKQKKKKVGVKEAFGNCTNNSVGSSIKTDITSL